MRLQVWGEVLWGDLVTPKVGGVEATATSLAPPAADGFVPSYRG